MERVFKIAGLVFGFFVVSLFVSSLTEQKFDKLKMSAYAGNSADVVSIRTRERQLECLALNIYREAGHEPFEGKVAVAQVTMNRVADGRFGHDVCGVVYKKNVVMDRVVCQFSWYCDSNHRNRPINRSAYDESYEVAKKVLLEGFRLSVLKDALFYHAVYVNPRWPHERIGQIGQHIFYRQRGPNAPRI